MQQLKTTKIGPWWKFWRRYKWRLGESYIYQSEILGYYISSDYLVLFPDGVLHIKRGYLWDGASGPTWDTPSCRRGGLLHDVLYQLMREYGLPRTFKKYADKLLRLICLEDGMWPVRADVWYQGVDIFGHLSLRKANE